MLHVNRRRRAAGVIPRAVRYLFGAMDRLRAEALEQARLPPQ